jgi:hypothetical protein
MMIHTPKSDLPKLRGLSGWLARLDLATSDGIETLGFSVTVGGLLVMVWLANQMLG